MWWTLAAALAAALTALGCSHPAVPKLEEPPNIPGLRAGYQVTAVVERGDYLDAVLRRGDDEVRFFFPNSPTCRQVIATEADVNWIAGGAIGEVRRGELECDPVGIASLETWRERRGRTSRRPLPRKQATFRSVYEDADYVLARGRFPLTGEIGWAHGYDTLALIPRLPECEGVIEEGVASIEYYVAGPDPYRLVVDQGYCPIDGWVQPLGPPR